MNKQLKIAIIDCIGLNYDGSTLEKKGIGGSESSIISIAKELVKLGFEVKVFNDCVSADTQPGVYAEVEYLPISALLIKDYGFDIVVSQRTVIPFTPVELYHHVRQSPPRDYNPHLFQQLQKPTQLKILWQQDTFIWGDLILEELVVNGYIDEIFNLSDWHISYTTNCNHGRRRNFEVLKKHVFHTRNAINRWIDWVDVKQKDPNLFVYNASITKGMIPLVTRIWPRIKQQLPAAQLMVIGGYYAFKDEPVSPAQQQWIDLQNSVKHDASIKFTGIIPQPEIARIMASASYNLYPGSYPETSGISTLESINYNTPIIGTRFGAMEESGTTSASYYIDYAIEPNSLFPEINQEDQINKYVDLVLSAVKNPYLHQQKQYACNIVKEVSTWDTVALQWKQHFYHKFNLSLSDLERERVEYINVRVHQVFGKRYANPEEIVVPPAPEKVTPLTNQQIKLAFIDIVGTSYSGNSLQERGLGGSESAVILMSEQLAKIGFDVTVFCGCDEDGNSPGVYNNVNYRPLSEIGTTAEVYDVVISSRCVTPFIPNGWYNYPQTTNRKIPYEKFEHIRNTASLKVFWLHDTFCWGDDVLEQLVHYKCIDEVWTLSDFHAMYIMNCSHPKMRNFEVLRNQVWTTRNGIVKYHKELDFDDKDPNLFMFNANMSKGLQILLDQVWPKLQRKIPQAKLKIIGGHYRLGQAFKHDESSEFDRIINPHKNNRSIEFTGIISQREVADICRQASYFIYPASLPETYGISTAEAVYAGVKILTCRFGALEETASPTGSYINYAIQPNGLFPEINSEQQVEKFVNLVVDTYYKNEPIGIDWSFRNILGWDSVALEWKQHLYQKLSENKKYNSQLYLSKEETEACQHSLSLYAKTFGRRSTSREFWNLPTTSKQRKIVVLSPFYNAGSAVINCIKSVLGQTYSNYEHILIDDASTDGTFEAVKEYVSNLPVDQRAHISLYRNNNNIGAVRNHVNLIRKCRDDDIVILLDGDDTLVPRPDIFNYYNQLHQNYDFTYGSCWSVVDSIPLQAQPYPPEVKDNKSYKQYHFNWRVPYTHLRTFKAGLIKEYDNTPFIDDKGKWFRAGGDLSTFYAAIGAAHPSRVTAVSDIVVNYNDASPLNDYKVNSIEQERTVNAILNTPKKNKRILLAIPTNKNIEAQTFKSIYDLVVPNGYEVEFQYFHGYQIDQIRNLIADWIVRYGYDYLFAVDSDIAFKPDTLVKLLSHNVDIASGIYIQRIPGTHTIEIMRKNQWGGVSHVNWAEIAGQGLVPIDACGFGCVLIKAEVFKAIPYPHFVYRSALDHRNTISEDVYFCEQASSRGFKLWADTSIICDHIGSYTFKVDTNLSQTYIRLKELENMPLLPQNHYDYLVKMRDFYQIKPKIAYDIGACVLHWSKPAKIVWNDCQFYAFESMESCEKIYQDNQIPYAIATLGSTNGREVRFYQNETHPGGNSYYQENEKYSPAALELFDHAHSVVKRTITLDTLAEVQGFPLPDLIKMDVQGAELDILLGAHKCLSHAQDLILELQVEEYNKGAPLADQVIDYLNGLGFELVTGMFSGGQVQGDYHFRKISKKH